MWNPLVYYHAQKKKIRHKESCMFKVTFKSQTRNFLFTFLSEIKIRFTQGRSSELQHFFILFWLTSFQGKNENFILKQMFLLLHEPTVWSKSSAWGNRHTFYYKQIKVNNWNPSPKIHPSLELSVELRTWLCTSYWQDCLSFILLLNFLEDFT